MSTLTLQQLVRKRLPHYLSPDVASLVNLDLPSLVQVAAGTRALDATQWRALARRLSIAIPKDAA